MSNVEEGLFGVERDKDVIAWRVAEITDQVVVVRFERLKNLGTQRFGGLMAFVVQGEMDALALGKLRFDILLALSFRQELLHLGIGAEFERALPGSDRFLGVIGGELRIT